MTALVVRGDTPPIWLGATQTGSDLEHLPLPWFRNAVDRLLADTVPRGYWLKVVASRQAREREAR